MMSLLEVILFVLPLSFRLTTCYNIDWSPQYTYYDGGTLNPYLITLRGSDPEYLLICFEEVVDIYYSGVCETLKLDISNNLISAAYKQIFKARNASNPHSIQIYNNGPTNYFILAYTNGPSRSSGPGQVLMGQFNNNDGTISYGGNTITFNPLLNDQSRLIELQNDGYFIICSSVGPYNQYDTGCRVASYNTDTLLIGGVGSRTFNMTEQHPTHSMVVERVASDGFVGCFVEYIQGFGACSVGTIMYSTNNPIESEILFANEVLFHNNNNEPVDEIKIVHVNQTTLVLCYDTHIRIGEGGSGQCAFGALQNINGRWTMLILPQRFQFADHSVISLSLFRVNANSLAPDYNNPELIVVCYVDGTNGFCRFGIVDLDALTITFEDGTTNNFHPSGTALGAITTSYLGYGRNSNEANYLVICYTQFAGSTPLFNKGYCKLGTITD